MNDMELELMKLQFVTEKKAQCEAELNVSMNLHETRLHRISSDVIQVRLGKDNNVLLCWHIAVIYFIFDLFKC